ALRKKLENELSKKRGGSRSLRKHAQRVAGTVSALRPAQALTVKENMLVMEAAQLLAAKRCDCVLVVDEDDHLSGIFTAKDIAYRVVAEELDASHTTVATIMTRGPMCVTSDTSATDALNLMVTRGFRHLPVCNEEGDIFGLLDITKCLYEALDKMERAYGSSRKLYDALEGVEREWSSSPIQLVQYMEALRDRMSCPDLHSVLDGSPPPEVDVKVNVREIAKMMRELHTTAVLVTNREGLAGIFTTKDIVLRVVAAGLHPEKCSVVRVMTPNPDTASPQTSIMDALRKMNDGHYLNLPVMDGHIIVGMVDVLKLTYATLEQMNSIQGNDGEGPMWSRFWDSFGSTDHTETESQLSDPMLSHHPSTNMHPAMHAISPEPSLSYTHLQGYAEILPNESASMVATNDDALSTISSRNIRTHGRDDGTFSFKFTSLSGRTHRFVAPLDSYSQLFDSVLQKVATEHLTLTGKRAGEGAADPSAEWLSISYMDDENDEVLMSSDADVQDAVMLARKVGQSRVKLFIHDAMIESIAVPNISELDVRSKSVVGTSHMEMEALVEELEAEEAELIDNNDDGEEDTAEEEETEEEYIRKSSKKRSHRRHHYDDGFPRDLLLPAAIVFLGVVVVGVFAISRISPR
ncbi:hypothetical protein PHYBLDRAFT_97179, partial [Phycomyces blakesleeanus NRRL 1555(-)]